MKTNSQKISNQGTKTDTTLSLPISNGMQKDFDTWNEQKKVIHHEGERNEKNIFNTIKIINSSHLDVSFPSNLETKRPSKSPRLNLGIFFAFPQGSTLDLKKGRTLGFLISSLCPATRLLARQAGRRPLFFSFLLIVTSYLLLVSPSPAQAGIIANQSNAGITDGLVGYWTFDGKDTNWNTNKTNDLSGQGNTGTMTSMSTTTSPVAGKIGQALKFSASYVDVGNQSTLNNLNVVTVSAWINPTAVPVQQGGGTVVENGLISNSGGTFSMIYSYDGSSRNNKMSFWNNGGSGEITSTISITPNSGWHHVVAVRTGTTGNWTASLYIDGVSAATPVTSATNPLATSNKTTIGSSNLGTVVFFPGKIDDVRIYNRALSAGEVKQLYKQGTALVNSSQSITGLSSGLVGYWTFDGKDTNWGTNKTNDLSGNGNTGTMTSMSTTTSPVAGKIGQGFNFKAENAYVTVGDPASDILDFGTGDFSIAGWVKFGGYVNQGNSGNIFLSKQNFDSAAGPGYGFRVDSTNIPTFKVATGTAATASFTNNIADNKWHYLVGVRDGTTIRAYLDGVAKGTDVIASGGSVSNAIAFIAGSDGALTNKNIKSSIDDVRVYNRALSAGEVAQLYKLGAAKLAVSPVNSLTKGLVGYWTFDGKDTNWGTNKTNDLSGNGNTGTMTSMSTTTSPVAGKIGQGFNFKAENAYVTVGDPASDILDFGTGDFSIAGWVKFGGYVNQGNSGNIFLSKQNFDSAAGPGYGFRVDSTNIPTFKVATGTAATASFTNNIADNKWHYLVGVRDGTTIRAYLDGVAKGTDVIASGGSVSNAIAFIAGSDGALTNKNIKSSIDDVRVYNRALSAGEVSQLYKLGTSKSR